MNSNLSRAETDALLEMLHLALLAIRSVGWRGDAERAAAIADALHNVPHLIARGYGEKGGLERCREDVLLSLGSRYPDLLSLCHPLDTLFAQKQARER